MTDAVKAIPCALPDIDDFLKAIAGMMRPIIHQEVKETVGATKIKIQHEHRHDHYSYSDSWSMVKDTAKKWIIGLSIFVLVQFGALAYCMHYVSNSELFLGKRCMDIYISDYVTEKEKKEMLKDCYWIAFYPKKYQDSPQALRERIRKNKIIIKDREFQSHFKKVSFGRNLR